LYDYCSQGITAILRTTYYLTLVLPRSQYASTSDQNSFSRFFKKEHAGVFLCLAGLYPGGLTADLVTTVFKAAASIVATNEDEVGFYLLVCDAPLLSIMTICI